MNVRAECHDCHAPLIIGSTVDEHGFTVIVVRPCQNCNSKNREAAEVYDAIKVRLPNIKVVERCPACNSGVIISLTPCDVCQDVGIRKRQATIDDVIESMNRPLLIYKELKNDVQ